MQLTSSQAHRGKGPLVSNTSSPVKCRSVEPMTIITKFSGSPVRKKSRTRKLVSRSRDLASTITLEGAAVGNANAKEQATVAGNTKPKGLQPALEAADVSTGIMVVAVPTKEKTCVATVQTRTIMRVTRNGGACAIASAIPLPRAMFKPD